MLNDDDDDEIDEDDKEIDMVMDIGNTIEHLFDKYLHTWNDLTNDEKEMVLVKSSIMIATIVRKKDDASDEDDHKLYATPSLDLEPTNRRNKK